MKATKKTLKVSFSTQKGGVGKSTITILLASVLHYRLGYNVLVMDCDFPQYSLSNMRERDKKAIMLNDYHKKAAMKQFQLINKKAYPIIRCKAENAIEESTRYIKQTTVVPDIIFYDLPGTANTKGVLTTLKSMNFIFAPMTADRLVVESTLGFTKAFMALPSGEHDLPQQELWLFWNQIDGREKTGLYEIYEKAIATLQMNIIETRIMDSKRFRKESDHIGNSIFRSTLLPADYPLLKATRMDLFVEEFLRITNL
ncbi:ParA family protein [Chryseobacterium sp. CFS15]|uniref:ParA family protein n=1 Tax=Chryseobacterium sp. CFS15 TaxID=2986946 RepID=UPI002808D0E1|nr:ParA family protein [Chryseobacterium sp. CFS15]MDQ8141520.1 ParA family protein [Chryseobacterium sp. CFS15]